MAENQLKDMLKLGVHSQVNAGGIVATEYFSRSIELTS